VGVVLQALAIVLWAAMGLFGVWLAVTGRPLRGVPHYAWSGWRFRSSGLVALAVAVFYIYDLGTQSAYRLQDLLGTFVAFGLLLLAEAFRWGQPGSRRPQVRPDE
jgi:hypothetical protein